MNWNRAFLTAFIVPVFATAFLVLPAKAETPEPPPPYPHVNAPNAQNLLNKVVAKHPEVKFLGIHMDLPHSNKNAIVAVTDPVRNGKPSSQGDMDTITSKKIEVSREAKLGGIFEVKSPVYDSKGEVIGMLVEQMSTSSVADEAAAQKATEQVVDELKQEIPNAAWMFKGKAK